MQTFRTVLEQKIRERRLTLEEFVEFTETFAREHQEPGTLGMRHLQRLIAGHGTGGRPLGPVRVATARLLEGIFGVSIDELLAPPVADSAAADRTRLVDGGLPAAFEWLDEQTGWSAGTSRREVESRMAELGTEGIIDRQIGRASVSRSRLTRALADYYGVASVDHDIYRASLAGRQIETTILTRPEWVDLTCPLTADQDQFVLAETERCPRSGLDAAAARHALDRLAEAATLNVRLTGKPVYRLLGADISRTAISGSVGLTPFVEYALTMDLLEDELSGALAENHSATPGELPLRDLYLPDLASVLDLRGRLCAGGVVALCAIARPADHLRSDADYALLVQERSGQVLNATRRLAVIPKGFHEPLRDVGADARIGATLRREMEEELFGREEVDSTAGESRVAAPMHRSRLSEPMRWLLDDPARLRTECTGFGLNLISGNYEFAGLIVIDDEEFWTRFGGDIEANWESSGLRLYSSLDGHLIEKLAVDESWSNEGLFAFLQGLRRLREIGGRCVDLPPIELMASER